MRVVCIQDDWTNLALYPNIQCPVAQQIYTVREVITFGKDRGYRLVEIINPPIITLQGLNEPAFDVNCFRPVTDISALQSLTKIKTRELEDA